MRDEDRDRISLRAAKSSGLILGSKLYNSLPGISCAKEFHPRDNYPWPRKWRLSPKRTRTRRTPVLRILGRRLPSIRLGVITEPTLPACTCTRPAWKMSGMRSIGARRNFPNVEVIPADRYTSGGEGKERSDDIDSVSSITAHSIKTTYPIFPPWPPFRRDHFSSVSFQLLSPTFFLLAILVFPTAEHPLFLPFSLEIWRFERGEERFPRPRCASSRR